jgi:hypothetical protein
VAQVGIVDTLLDTARADTDLLLTSDKHGDVLSKRRDVTFLLLAPEQAKAGLVANFIEDNRYGRAVVETGESQVRVCVHINMPIDQPIICSVSGLMACVAAIFGLEYDGWESEIQRAT